MRVERVGLALVLAAACGAQLKKDGTVCPEYRDLQCVLPPECTMNKTRGCRECVCSSPTGQPSTAAPEEMGPPEASPPN